MSDFRVLAHGLGRKEDADRVVNRPYGVNSFSLLRFHSPMEIRTELGLVSAEPGNCILIAPNFPQYYRGTAGEWLNDWMHFAGDNAEFYVSKYRIPLNTLLSPHSTNFLSPTFDKIANEERFQQEDWEEAVELLMCQLLFKLGRELKKNTLLLSPTEFEHFVKLRALRQQMRNELARPWTVNDMAESVGLSASRFATLYHQFFGVSPVEDLLRSRIRYARHLLTNRSGLISDIAKRCGYKNVNYFSRIFQKRVGCSPSYYQKHALNYYRNDTEIIFELDKQ